MKKLKLTPESLEVTSFEPIAAQRQERGTVQGASIVGEHTDHEGCVEITGAYPVFCTGPDCDYTLALSCVPDNCMSHEMVICRFTEEVDCA